MKRSIVIGLTTISTVLGILAGGLIYSILSENAALRSERSKVHSLIRIGQSLSDAERVLRESGYKLSHEKPIQPTIAKDYFQQLVIIGDTRPSSSDTFFYTITGGANPLRDESPYVIIDATSDGVITRIE